MQIVESYETVVQDLNSELDARIAYFPSTQLAGGWQWDEVDAAADALNVRLLRPIDSIQKLTASIAFSISGGEIRDIESTVPTQLLEFANYISHAELVPLRNSPWDIHSLSGIILSRSSAAIEATVGLIAGSGGPFVLVTVPAGIILVGGAIGLGQALEEGREGFGRWRRGS